MYCTNCGKQIDENADICLGCGKMINKTPQQGSANRPAAKGGNGKGIASMILGIIAAYFCLSAFAAFGELEYTLYEIEDELRIFFAIGFVLMQSIFGVLALIFSVLERKDNKNGFNTAGFWLAIATFVCVAIQFFAVLAM